MTVTEAPSSTSAEAAPARPAEPRGVAAVLGTGDHKTVGRLWLGTAALFLVGITVIGALLGFEAVTVDKLEILGNSNVLQLFTLYRVGLVFLVVLPLFLGLATFIVPLQVGASTLAFPRAAAAAYWSWLGSSVLLLVSYGIDGGPGGTDADAVTLWILAFGLVVVSLLLATVCVVTTAIALRAPRMSLLQVPPFTWSMVVAGSVWLLSLPVLLAGLVLAYLDLRYGPILFTLEGSLFTRLQWAFDQPQVYVLGVPVLGVLAEMVPVAAGVAQRLRGVVWAGIAGFGIFAFGAWAQPFYRPDLVQEAVYIGVAFAIGLPLLIVVGGMADCAVQHRPKPRPPLLLAGLAVLLLAGAVAAGAVAVIEPFELLGTTWQVGHLNLVAGASLVGVLAGLAWWAPKIWGRHLPGALAIVGGLLLGGGAVLVAVPQGIAGVLDQPAFQFGGFEPRDGVELLNTISAVGTVVVALGALVLLLGLLRTAVGEPVAGLDDPWGGQTLEWSTTSPPPPENFAVPVPEVTSATPLLVEVEVEGS
jgi:cytochrome c oxidase subunit I